MRLLLDSSGATLVCALADAEGVILERRYPTGAHESRDIGAVAGEVLGELGPGDLDAVVAGTGPGTFIGTRVAISYANGMGAAGGVRLYGVNSLAAIAAVHGTGLSVVLRDARRGQVYWYGPAGAEQPCRLVDIAELPHELAAVCVDAVIIEEPGKLPSGKHGLHAEIVDAATAAGARVITCDGVPAEGLRRLRAVDDHAPAYIEPVYLRGFV